MSDYPTMIPYLYYADGVSAMDWIVRVFGLHERSRDVQDGRVVHAEVGHGDAVIFVSGMPDAAPAKNAGGLYVKVDDVDKHFAHVKECGVQTQDEPTDQPWGHRIYGVLDLEGHQWWFWSPTR